MTTPTNDPTAPSVSKALNAVLTTIAGSGVGLNVADYVQHGRVQWPNTITAGIAVGGLLLHSTDVGRRFLAWVQHKAPELDAIDARVTDLEPQVAIVAGQVAGLDPQLGAQVTKANNRVASLAGELDALKTRNGLTDDDVRRIFRESAVALGLVPAAGGQQADFVGSGGPEILAPVSGPAPAGAPAP